MSRNLPLSMPMPLPLDIKLMNAFSMAFGLAFAAMALTVLVSWLMRQPMFNLSAINVQGDLQRNNAVTLRANVAPRLSGNFFTADLAQTRQAFESVPWVRRAMVQREFPNRLKVVLQEHQPRAYWGPEGDVRMLNTFGEIFEANLGDVEDDDLPALNGPDEQAPLVLLAYTRLAVLFDSIDKPLVGLALSHQGGWRADLDDGVSVELGHGTLDELTARTRRFVGTYTQVSSRYGRELESADLRYGNGYAIKLQGVTTTGAGEAPDKKAKR